MQSLALKCRLESHPQRDGGGQQHHPPEWDRQEKEGWRKGEAEVGAPGAGESLLSRKS